jgi:hypothetical protein
VRFEVFMVVKSWIMFLHVEGTCGLAGDYQCFGGTYCFHLRDKNVLKMEAICSWETLITTYKTTRCHKPDHLIFVTSYIN